MDRQGHCSLSRIAKCFQWVQTKPNSNKKKTKSYSVFRFINWAQSNRKVPRRKRKTQSPRGAISPSGAAFYLAACTCFSRVGQAAGRKPCGAAPSEVLSAAISTFVSHWLSRHLLLVQSKYFICWLSLLHWFGTDGFGFPLGYSIFSVPQVSPCLSSNSLTSFHLLTAPCF